MVSPGELIKYPQTFHKSCPPYLKGGKMSQFLAQNLTPTPIVFRTPYFGTAALYRKQKQTMIGLHHTKLGVGGSPELPEPLVQWVPQRVKVQNFLYILHSSGPRQVQRHQCYTTCWGRSFCNKRLCYCRGTARRATSVEILWPFFD